jgi:hypothetical protein
MIRAIMAASTMAAIASCNASVGDMPLAGLDLNDAGVVGQIARQLPDRERTAFKTYALLHWPGSKTYCGRPIAPSARVASTVGEAITQTLEFEAELAATRLASQAEPASDADRLRERRTDLTDRIENLVLKRDALYVRLGAAARTSREADLLEQEMQRMQAQRAAVDAELVQAATARR